METHGFTLSHTEDAGTVRVLDVRRMDDGSFAFRWRTKWAGAESTEVGVRLGKIGMEMLAEALMVANSNLDKYAIPPKTDTGTAPEIGVQAESIQEVYDRVDQDYERKGD